VTGYDRLPPGRAGVVRVWSTGVYFDNGDTSRSNELTIDLLLTMRPMARMEGDIVINRRVEEVAVGQAGKNTLRTRIRANHIAGRIRGSTFRLTLASVLAGQLGLSVAGAKTLLPEAEREVSGWIRRTRPSWCALPNAGALADLETALARALDPPSTSTECGRPQLRRRLAALRRSLEAKCAQAVAGANIPLSDRG
jgi:hypothetical protein